MANENKTAKEYVQKGYLIAHLANCGIRTINYDEWERLCECIHEAKPADVVEVVHGEWIMINEQLAKCSVCGGYESINGKDKTGKGVIFKMQKKFCPNCGADMKGGTDNGNSI